MARVFFSGTFIVEPTMTYPTMTYASRCGQPRRTTGTGKTLAFGSLITLALLLGSNGLRAQANAADDTSAPGAPNAAKATPSALDDKVVQLDAFVVSGIRASAMKAQEIKRNSPQIIEAIVAEDIGKFPDNNVVESLQRVPGIQVTDYGAGNITHVTIRGLDDVTTTLNGRNIFTASGLSLSLQDIPASLLSEVDVKKTRSAADIETGIAGVIDIHTHRPFDFSGRRISIAAKGTYQEQAGKYDPNISALFSDRWKVGSTGSFGALVNVSYLTTNYRDQSVTPGAQVPFVTANPPAGWVSYERIFPTDGRVSENPIWQAGLDEGLPRAEGSTLNFNGVPVPYVLSRDAIFQADSKGKTKRPAANLSLQYAPNLDSEYTFELFYDGYRNENFNNLLFSFVDWWGGPLGPVTIYPGTNVVKSRDLVSNVYTFNSGDMSTGKTDSYQLSLGGKWNLTRDFKLRSEVVYQTSEFNSKFFALRSARNSPNNIAVDFNDHDGVPAFSFPGVNIADPSLWNLDHIWDQAHRNKGSAVTLTEEGTLNTDWGIIRKLRFGVRYDDRKASEAQRLAEGQAPNVPLASHPELVYINSGFFDGRAKTPSSWAAPNGYYTSSHTDEVRTLAGMPTSDQLNLTESFHVDEATTAAYLEVDEFRADLGGHKLSGQFGGRLVNIKTNMTATDQVTLAQNSGSVSVTKLLPSGVVSFEITPDLVARVAYGQTLRRPAFGDLNPLITYTRDVTNIGYGTASGGNPNLKPTTSRNYDLALEYYLNDASSLNVALFRRDIDGLVVGFRHRVTYTDDIGTYDYILSQPGNASNGELEGVEIGGKYYPKNLPGIFNGLGAEASYTHLRSSQDIPVTDDVGNVVRTINSGFPSVSPDSYSVTLAYERSRLSARASYTWRSAFFHNNEAPLFANPLPIYDSAQRSLNAQISYRVTDNFVLTLEGNNLTNDIMQSYYGNGANSATTNNFGSWIVGRTVAVGARYSF
jgi:TonB-dependent receptor